MAFKNVNVDRSNLPKKSRFNFSHLCSTTLDWGKLTPIHCQRIAMGDHSDKIEVNARIRLAPMVSPTLGNIQVKTYWQFVKMSDVFKDFPHFLAGLPRYHENAPDLATFTPTYVPFVTPSFLMYILCNHQYSRSMKFVRAGRNQTNQPWTFNTWRDSDQMGNWVNVFSGMIDFHLTTQFKQFLPNYCFGLIDSPQVTFNTDRFSPEEADFRVFNHTDGDDGTFYGKYTRKGLALYNAFLTCGLIPNFRNNKKMDATPLFALYKAYFDIIAPQYRNWEQTHCYHLIKYYDNNGVRSFNCPALQNWGNGDMPKELMTEWLLFFDELSDLVYYADNDFLSTLINTNYNEGSLGNYANLSELHLDNYASATQGTRGFGIEKINTVADTSNDRLDYVSDEWLKRAYKYANTKSSIGMAIKSVMIARGLTDFVEQTDSSRVGNTSDAIVVDEIVSTADTETRQLGDYGGIASDSKVHGKFTHKSNAVGYYFGFATIVPEDSNFVNAVDLASYNITNDSYYSGMFDGLGFEPVVRTAVGYQDTCVNSSSTNSDDSTVLGLTPRHTCYKIGRDTMHGCFGLTAHQNALRAYHLHKLLPKNADLYDADKFTLNDDGSFIDSASDTFLSRNVFPSANPDWYRRLDGHVTSGHYDRIFAINAPKGTAQDAVFNDNLSYPEPQVMALFVIQHFSDARMLPIEDTWQTTDDDSDDKKVSLNKA